MIILEVIARIRCILGCILGSVNECTLLSCFCAHFGMSEARTGASQSACRMEKTIDTMTAPDNDRDRITHWRWRSRCGCGTRLDGQFVGARAARETIVRGGDRRSHHRLMRVVSSCRRLRVRLVVEREVCNHSLPSPNLHYQTERLESNLERRWNTSSCRDETTNLIRIGRCQCL